MRACVYTRVFPICTKLINVCVCLCVYSGSFVLRRRSCQSLAADTLCASEMGDFVDSKKGVDAKADASAEVYG